MRFLWNQTGSKVKDKDLTPILPTRPVGFPKRAATSGIESIHDFHHRNPLNVKRLSKTEALYNR
jgi:hypothetical protein